MCLWGRVGPPVTRLPVSTDIRLTLKKVTAADKTYCQVHRKN